jgi:predicted nuclease of restriction endonuclease-like (RecB) superfamily
MKQFYIVFSNEKVSPLVTQLTWTHYLLLISIKDYNEIKYYIELCTKNNLSKRELENKIKSKEYQRLDENTKLKLTTKEEPKVIDLIKNPIIINNKNSYEVITEKILQKLILEDLNHFLKELGNSFCFISNEYKIKIGDTYNYIDLLLYNIEFNCYVVIELKVTELKKEYIGQVEVYMNYIDNNLRTVNQDKTIGTIICKKDNKYIMEYCSDKRIIAKEYQLA